MSDQRYSTIKTLGRGAMGKVVLAEDRELGRLVAIKLVSSQLMENKEAMARFSREARVQSLVQNPHLVAIYDCKLEPPTPYLAMEYVQGEDLEGILKKEGKLDAARVARWGKQLAEGLHALHTHGAVHRDLKPANLMVRNEDGSAVVMDLGLASLEGATILTKTGQAIGTPLYFPPELLRAEAATPAADQYQLAIIMFELLTGQRALPGKTLEEVARNLHEHRLRPFPPSSTLPEAARAALRRGSAHEPGDRFPDIREFAQAFADGLEPGAVPGPAPPPREDTHPLEASPAAGPAGFSTAALPAEPTGRGRPLALGLGFCAFVLVGLLAPWGGSAPPSEIRWEVVGDTLVADFAGGVGASLEAGDLPVEDIAAPEGRRRLAARGLPPDVETPARLVWAGGATDTRRFRAGAPAVLPDLGFGPPGTLRVFAQREVSGVFLGVTVGLQPGANDLQLPDPSWRGPVELAWTDQEVPFTRAWTEAEVLASQARQLRAMAAAARAADALGDRPPELAIEATNDAGKAIRKLDEVLPSALEAVAEFLRGEAPVEDRRATLRAVLGWAVNRAFRQNREYSEVPPGLPPGSPGSLLYRPPEWRRQVLEHQPVDLGDEALQQGLVNVSTATPDIERQLPSLGAERARKYARALQVRWPEAAPRTGEVCLGVLSGRVGIDERLVVRDAEGQVLFQLWTAQGTDNPGQRSAGWIGLLLPADLAPAGGDLLQLEVHNLSGVDRPSVRVAAVEVWWPE